MRTPRVAGVVHLTSTEGCLAATITRTRPDSLRVDLYVMYPPFAEQVWSPVEGFDYGTEVGTWHRLDECEN